MYFLLLLVTSLLLGCPKPFVVKELSIQSPRTLLAPGADNATIDNAKKALLKKRYQQVHSPSFAIVNAYYRLPEHKPYGALSLTRSYSYMGVIEELKIENGTNDSYAITPIEGDEALSMESALNNLLDIGVHIKELSFSDATMLAKAEQEAQKQEKTLLFSVHLLPKVDYLITFNKTSSERGPVLVGRVLSKVGRLMAFKVVYQPHYSRDLGPFIVGLFEDTINRL